jgi:hypothetical protein
MLAQIKSDSHFIEEINKSSDSSLYYSGVVINPEQEYTGLLEILNDPPAGQKQFCGKIIDLKFIHKLELPSSWIIRDDETV